MAKGGDSQNQGNGKNPTTGQPLVKTLSPAAGSHPTLAAGQGSSVPYAVGGSVLGTGVNPDRVTYGAEAV